MQCLLANFFLVSDLYRPYTVLQLIWDTPTPLESLHDCFRYIFQSFVEITVKVQTVEGLGDTNVNTLSDISKDSKYLREKHAIPLQPITEPNRTTGNSATSIDHPYDSGRLLVSRRLVS